MPQFNWKKIKFKKAVNRPTPSVDPEAALSGLTQNNLMQQVGAQVVPLEQQSLTAKFRQPVSGSDKIHFSSQAGHKIETESKAYSREFYAHELFLKGDIAGAIAVLKELQQLWPEECKNNPLLERTTTHSEIHEHLRRLRSKEEALVALLSATDPNSQTERYLSFHRRFEKSLEEISLHKRDTICVNSKGECSWVNRRGTVLRFKS